MRSIIAFLKAFVVNGASFARKYFSFIGACVFISSPAIELKSSNTKHASLSPAKLFLMSDWKLILSNLM